MKLSAEVELALVGRANAGDEAALQTLLDVHADAWMKATVQQFTAHSRWLGLEKDDLEHDAYVAFITAVRHFDQARGTLEAFAKTAVHGAMRHARSRRLEFSEAARRAYARVCKAQAELAREGLVSPSPADVAKRTGDSKAVVEEIFNSQAVHDAQEVVNNRPSALPNPEAELVGRGFWWRLQAELGAPAGGQWIGLLLLHEEEGHDWKPITRALRLEESDIPRHWPAVCSRHQIPEPVVPRKWPAYVAFFPPPALTAEAVKQFYSRTRHHIVEKRNRLLSGVSDT